MNLAGEPVGLASLAPHTRPQLHRQGGASPRLSGGRKEGGRVPHDVCVRGVRDDSQRMQLTAHVCGYPWSVLFDHMCNCGDPVLHPVTLK